MESNEEKKEVITPSQYFDYLKGAKQTITTDALKKSYEVFLKLGDKYRKLGQIESLKKLCFLARTLKKEEKVIELGINTFVYKNVLEDYMDSVKDKAVKLVELSRYMREIPDELVETIEICQPIFNEFYVVFTDYTGREERKVEKERRDKDPILFGVFKEDGYVADRLYFLGDWVDEYCDLTLDKMITEYTEKFGESLVHTEVIPETSEELINILNSYVPSEKEGNEAIEVDVADESVPLRPYVRKAGAKASLFTKVRSVFSKK